jgi:hypothetical protein
MKRMGIIGRGLIVACAAVIGCMGWWGCTEGSSPTLHMEPNSETIVTPQSRDQQGVLQAFEDFAQAMGTVPVFGLESLPSGMEVASQWWPVLDQARPEASAESVANPRVEGSPRSEPEGELLLRCGDGWLDVLANFRGDLGDVNGESVGSVAGRPANLYQVNGGWLVQWSHEGRWYGLFGRGVPRDVVTSTALSMMLIERY